MSEQIERYNRLQLSEEDFVHRLVCGRFSQTSPFVFAHSGEDDRPFRPKVITVSGDRDHSQCASFGVPGKDGAANTTGRLSCLPKLGFGQ
jgi:hypothetical protein